jgi:hypothetical protein
LQRKNFFQRKSFFFYFIDIQLFTNSLRARAFHIRKKAVFGTFQIFFLKKFCSSEKRFYNSHVLESQTNGKQVRRKTNKKIDSKKQKSKDRRERETKSPFCGKPIFEAWKIKNSPVRFGAIK